MNRLLHSSVPDRREPVSPLRLVARERIRDRLRSAETLLTSNTLDDARRLRDVLEDAVAQSEAFEMVLSNSTDHAAPPCAVLESAALEAGAAPGEPVSEFRLIPFGAVRVERPVAGGSFEFTPRHARAAADWFTRLGRKLAIDYEHQSFERFNRRDDGLRPAAGWIAGLEVREDGLWATGVTWTPRARALLRTGEYRYFSPVIYWNDEDYSEVASLGPVALTNDPAMHGVESLTTAAARGGAGDEDDLEEDFDGNEAPNGSEASTRVETRLARAERELDVLRRMVMTQRADAFVERGLRSGRIVDATSMDWREDYLRDPSAAERRLERAPVLLHAGRLSAPPPTPAAPDPGREGEAADLAAFEAARGAGRVQACGGTRL